MPPKQKITREMILECAFAIAEREGIMAVTSRSIAKELGCSIQPVFSHFPTMEALRQATFDYACSCFVDEVLQFGSEPDFFQRTTKWVLDLARNRPQLFRLLYLSDGFKADDFTEALMSYESSQKMVARMMEVYQLDEGKCKDILMRASLFLIGICTMIALNHMDFSDEEAADMMKRTVSEMVRGAKERE